MTVFKNATYQLRELDGTLLRVPIAGKRIKMFKGRGQEVDLRALQEYANGSNTVETGTATDDSISEDESASMDNSTWSESDLNERV